MFIYRIFFSLDKNRSSHKQTSTHTNIYHVKPFTIIIIVLVVYCVWWLFGIKSYARISTAGKSLTLWSCRFSFGILQFLCQCVFHAVFTLGQMRLWGRQHSKIERMKAIQRTKKVCDRISISFWLESLKVWRKEFTRKKKWMRQTSSSSPTLPPPPSINVRMFTLNLLNRWRKQWCLIKCIHVYK